MFHFSRSNISSLLAGASLFTAVTVVAASAEELRTPVGDVLLRVQGLMSETNTEGAAVFDFDALAAMDSTTYKTSTIWTDGVIEFTGVPLKVLLNAVGARGNIVAATAVNDYTVDIPVDSITDDVPIIAYHMNQERFSLRDKGPLWMIYPHDSSDRFRTEEIYSRSIWQLDRLNIHN